MKQNTPTKFLDPSLLQSMTNTVVKQMNTSFDVPQWIAVNRALTTLRGYTINELGARDMITRQGKPSLKDLETVKQNCAKVTELFLSKLTKLPKKLKESILKSFSAGKESSSAQQTNKANTTPSH